MKAKTFDSAKKVFLILAIVFLVLGTIISGCSHTSSNPAQSSSNDDTYYEESDNPTVDFKSITWPTHGIATLLPVPSNLNGSIGNESSDSFWASVSCTESEYSSYVSECMEAGFDIDYSRDDEYFSAYDSSKNCLFVNFNKEYLYMDIDLSAGDKYEYKEEGDNSSTSKSSTDAAKKSNSKKDKSGKSSSSNNGIDPVFKEAMDSYEDFFDEYVSFMKKYSKSKNPASMAVDYAKFASQYATTMKKMEDLEKEDLTPQEEKYYLEVQTRINKKLSEVATAL